jgi:signal transduction histidine kinase/CheY-like chemotaxis protein
MNDWKLLTHELRREEDVVTARQRARQIAASIGFDLHEQTRIGTAVSEIARNAYRYAGGGLVSFGLSGQPQHLVVIVADRGPGIADSELIFSGEYVSTSGMGIGLAGARRLMDSLELQTGPDGTTVTLRKRIPLHRTLESDDVNRLIIDLQRDTPDSPLDELQQQNRELLRAIDEVQVRQLEIQRLNHELEETNRGVLALNAELEDKADSLRQASETKSRFLSHMSHEFRTPLNSIRSLASMLASHLDGPLTGEQERQVDYIRKGADSLLEMVNDLLDLAKIEAGKIEVHPSEFTISGLFAALRGMFRPLITSDAVLLRFGKVAGLPALYTDESKLSQILRNLISNALKYTERGEVEVTAEHLPEDRIRISVRDTGIGIPPEHLNSLFKEFVQIMNPLQKRTKGTGLGLSLSQQLAVLLGGGIEVSSTVGEGSTFVVTIRRELYAVPPQIAGEPEPSWRQTGDTPVILIVDDAEADRYALRILMPPSCEILEASGGASAMDQLARRLPDIVFLDLAMPDMSGFELLTAIKSAPDTRDVRVIIHSSQILTAELRSDLLKRGAEEIIEKGYSDLEMMRRRVASVIDPSNTASSGEGALS